jgi:hypothetical protein
MSIDLLRNTVVSVWSFSKVGMSSYPITIEPLSVLEQCPQNVHPLFLFTPEDKLRGQERFFVTNICLCIVKTTEEADTSGYKRIQAENNCMKVYPKYTRMTL